jgi:ankyrin repeat protein
MQLIWGLCERVCDRRLGSTALHRAVSHGQIGVVKKLLSPGIEADIAARNNIGTWLATVPLDRMTGNTCLHIAAYMGNVEMARILMDHGAHRLRNDSNKVLADVACVCFVLAPC